MVNPSISYSKKIILPNGIRVDLSQVPSYSVSSSVITFLFAAGGSVAYTASSDVVAQQIAATIDLLTEGTVMTVLPDPGVGLSFTAISPNTGTAPLFFNGYITGTGFISAGILSVQFDDGSGHVFSAGISVQNDSLLNPVIESPGYMITPAGTYTVYYTLDGSTWTTTGLTIVIS